MHVSTSSTTHLKVRYYSLASCWFLIIIIHSANEFPAHVLIKCIQLQTTFSHAPIHLLYADAKESDVQQQRDEPTDVPYLPPLPPDQLETVVQVTIIALVGFGVVLIYKYVSR